MCRASDALLHQVVGGRWRLLDVLYPTEHGAAYRVEALEDGRLCRLELWDQRHVERRGELARFEREARSLSRLRHERYLSVVAFGVHEGRPFLVSELPKGKALRDELGNAELTVTRAVALGLQLCEGLAHLHRHGMAHRVLLPEDLWLAPSPAGDLLKIGLPHIAETQEDDRTDATRHRLYRPPQRSAARLDQRADLYAAGMLLYVMCTGREPPDEVIAATAGGAPVPPPRTVSPERGISEALERVILRAVAPAPDVRFGTADELIAALQSTGARPTTPKRRPTQPPRKRTAMVAAAFATIAILGVGALRGSGRPSPSAPPVAQAAQHPGVATEAARPRLAMVTPPVAEPRPSITAQAPALPPVAIATRAPAPDERSEIWSLLDSGRLDEGATRIKSLVAMDPDAAWPRFALGVLFYRRYWRHDSIQQWRQALAQSPEIRNDPQFGAYLCFMLDDTWKAAGVTELLNQLGAEAVPLLDHCAASAKTPRLRAWASHTLAQLRRTDRRFRR
jgi:hypothetical protein